MRRAFLLALTGLAFATHAVGQSAISAPRAEDIQKEDRAVARAQEEQARSSNAIEFQGERAFKEDELRSQLKEEIATINEFGLTAARADDAAFFLDLFYRKHGYVKVNVRYILESPNRLRLVIDEGPLMTLGNISFEGNVHEPSAKLFDYAVGPTRQRYSQLQKDLPFVAADINEGADLVRRLYVSEGFLDVVVDKPRYTIDDKTNQVEAIIPIQEGRQYFFGNVSFDGKTVYDRETLIGQIKDLLTRPYTEARVADIPRRLQAYFKSRGYYAVKIEATGNPTNASNGHVPVQVAVSTGPVYHFGDVTVAGLQRLHPSYVENRFTSLEGKTYSPEVLDDKFRLLMRSGLFNLLQINPVPEDGDTLRLEISAEEAKSKELGFSVGYGTYEGFIGGVQFRERDLFGYGRPLTTSIEVSQRSYKGEIVYEDPYLFNSEFDFKARVAALTFDFDGYSKFELGGSLALTRKFTKQYEAGLIFTARHVEITSADINSKWLGPTVYFINTLGFTQTLDLRADPLVAPRGFVAGNTVDVATSAFGSDIELIRATLRFAYYIPFSPKPLLVGVADDDSLSTSAWQRWFRQSMLAFGARGGIVHSLNGSGPDEATTLPIDERFFNGGANSVRSFAEFDLGPHDRHGHPVGGEFDTVFNVEYTFPIWAELQGAVFFDAGNLLPTSEDPGLDDMRYAIGLGLRYKLPIGPIRLDYGFNPDPRGDEAFGAFHFSFGFAF